MNAGDFIQSLAPALISVVIVVGVALLVGRRKRRR
jgi:LPXTG-motif cell wall-anchored protein